MRQGQQNRRGRGRSSGGSNNNNNNNRKHQNPLARTFESNGPDVKIRGTPAHVAEKYVAMARDALASGDPVLAENYLQHAEHYNRIIMAYREQQAEQQAQRQRSFDSPSDDDMGDEDGGGERPVRARGEDGPRREDVRRERPPRSSEDSDDEDDAREARSETDGDEERQPGPRSRSRHTRMSGRRERGDRERGDRDRGDRERDGNRDAVASDQPDFLTRPIRRPRREVDDAPESSDQPGEVAASADSSA